MFYIVAIFGWVSSASDEHHWVYLEKAGSPEQAEKQALSRLDYPEQVYEVVAKEVNEANLGLVYIGY
jgi:hypothetical protein